MNNKTITPNPQQPVDRVPTGQLPSALAELSEAALSSGVLAQCICFPGSQRPDGFVERCSYDGDDD
jgi:bacteriocin leader peptide (microcyclamide/patellamide family)